jgi:polysaccharide chain length determinant protein (PEP-CTERM system associated)
VSRRYTVADILHLIVRGRQFILVPIALGLAVVPVLSRYAPARYRSEALILVIPQRVPDNYVKPTVSQTVEERLPAITDQILSRSRLERIIVEMDLYKRERTSQVMEDVVEAMRRDVATSAVGKDVGKDKDVDSFRVSFVSDHAETARKVTERLASLYIEQNVKDRELQADSTSQFLGTQLEEAKRRLVEQEKKLETYRKSHAGQLPSQLQGNLQAIQNANLQLQSLNESTNRAQERRLLIERQIADAQAVPLPAAVAQLPTSEAPQPRNTALQLEVARARLAALLQHYTPDHPEVVSAQRTVAELVAALENETPLSATQPEAEKPISPAEATQRKRLLDLQAELAVIDHQLKANRDEETNLKAVVTAYQAKVDVVPTRESELVELTRDYSTLQSAYANLLTKREDSVIAANLERGQIGEQFKLLDVASLPERPYNQTQRVEIMASGVGCGLVFGLLVIGLRDLRDTSFRYKEEALKALSLPVLASIPVMISQGEIRAKKRRGWIADLGGVALFLIVSAALVFWRMRS